MKRNLAILGVLVCSSLCFADSSDNTLRLYLSKSDMVVLGKITSEPSGVFGEAGVPNYVCDFFVHDVLKGDAKTKGKTVKVNIVRFEAGPKDRHPLIKQGGECILFLKAQSKGTIP